MIAFEEDPIRRFHRVVNEKRETPKSMYEIWLRRQSQNEDEEEISGVRISNAHNVPNDTR